VVSLFCEGPPQKKWEQHAVRKRRFVLTSTREDRAAVQRTSVAAASAAAVASAEAAATATAAAAESATASAKYLVADAATARARV